MEIKDRDLENVNGGFLDDYDIKYKKENSDEPDEPINPGTYTVGISMKQKILPPEIDIEDIERYRQG